MISTAREKSRDSIARSNKSNLFDNSSNILKGVCICLTGLEATKKSYLHSLVEDLGGKYCRALETQKTTHLIAERPEGDKYTQAKLWPHIEIVTPKWLEDCANKKVKLPADGFRVIDDSSTRTRSAQSTSNSANMDAFQAPSFLENSLKSLLVENAVLPNPLFSGCCFFLLGFPEEDLEKLGEMAPSSVKGASSNHSRMKLKMDFCRLIRRCMGTIFWEVNKDITHVIVDEESDMKTRNDVANFCSYHPNAPVAVAPEWVVSSVQNKHLVKEIDYPPKRRIVNTIRVKKKSPKSQSKSRSKVQIFSQLFFHILPCNNVSASSPDSTSNKTDPTTGKYENIVRFHGGQLLSRDGIRLLQNIPKSTKVNASSGSKRKQIPKCYLVHISGPFNLDQAIKGDALLRHISQHNLCNIIPVNRIWLQTCDMCKAEISPYDYEKLFIPKNLPIRSIQNGVKLKIAVTGFKGVERIGLRNIVESIGAVYTDDMGSKNTHLICKEAVGPKYDKAIEWGLHVVSVDWLYRICYHGYKPVYEETYSLVQSTESCDSDERDDSQETTILCSQDF